MGVRVKPVTEAEFTSQVLEYAIRLGWMAAHFRTARTNRGWRTAVQGKGKGFPDIIACRGGVQFVAELKVGRNVPTPEQDEWLEVFASCGVATYLWYPKDWPEIERVLT